MKRDDVDMIACQLVVREGKGSKDRQFWYPENLQDLLGHSDLSTTMIYT